MYDTGPRRDLVDQEGVTNDALYLDATLALNPDTGELVWHFQHQANGQWDLDWAFERQVMELPVNGVMTRVVCRVAFSSTATIPYTWPTTSSTRPCWSGARETAR